MRPPRCAGGHRPWCRNRASHSGRRPGPSSLRIARCNARAQGSGPGRRAPHPIRCPVAFLGCRHKDQAPTVSLHRHGRLTDALAHLEAAHQNDEASHGPSHAIGSEAGQNCRSTQPVFQRHGHVEPDDGQGSQLYQGPREKPRGTWGSRNAAFSPLPALPIRSAAARPPRSSPSSPALAPAAATIAVMARQPALALSAACAHRPRRQDPLHVKRRCSRARDTGDAAPGFRPHRRQHAPPQCNGHPCLTRFVVSGHRGRFRSRASCSRRARCKA